MSILRRFTDFVLQNRYQAMGVAFVLAYIPLLGSISILIAGLITLRKGILEGALVLFAATVPFILSYFTSPPPVDQAVMALIAMVTIIVSNGLVWVYAVLLRKYNNWSLILELSILLGAIVIGAAHFFNPDLQNWWGAQLTAYFTKAMTMMNGLPSADVKVQLQAVDVIKPFATGLVATSIILNGLLQLALARWWQVSLYETRGTLRKELQNIRFGYVMGVLFVVVLGLSFLGNATILDVRPVFYGLFFIAGLSLVHCLLAPVKYSWFWLVLVYVALIILFPKSAIALAILALLDVLLNFRQRLARI